MPFSGQASYLPQQHVLRAFIISRASFSFFQPEILFTTALRI
jgi:hypothetical protein